MKDTGHGATIAFGTSGFTAKWRKIGAVEHAGEKVDSTTLDASGFKTFLPGDILDPGEVELEIAFDSEGDQPTALEAETITITFPLAPGQATPATLAGTGFTMSFTASPEMSTNTLQVGKLKVAFDGETGPAWTPAA